MHRELEAHKNKIPIIIATKINQVVLTSKDLEEAE